jgi:hypothetical protein
MFPHSLSFALCLGLGFGAAWPPAKPQPAAEALSP